MILMVRIINIYITEILFHAILRGLDGYYEKDNT